MFLTASQLRSLLNILYVLVVDYRESADKKAKPEAAGQLKSILPAAEQWTNLLPSLPATIKAAGTGRNKVEALVSLGVEIQESFQQFRSDRQFTSDELQTLRALGQYLRTDSESAYATLMKNAALSENPWVTQKMRPKAISQSSVEPELKKLVQKMVGRAGTVLTLEEAALARSTYPEEYKEYLALRRVFNQAWKNALTGFVRSTGKSKIPYQDLLDGLDAAGVKYSLSKGFTGLVDDQGRLYTSKGEAISGVPSAANFPTVIMNPEYPKTQWVFQTVRPNGEPGQYFYTEKFRKAQAAKKFANVERLSAKMPSIRKKWWSLIKNFEPNNPATVAALVLELLYLFSARVGTPGNATFGIGTLQIRHLKVMDNGDIVIAYKGKDGVPHRHLLKGNDVEQKLLIKCLLQLIDGRDPKERVFMSNRKLVGPAAANALFKNLSGMSEITVHKIRTYRGTELFKELMKKEMPKLLAVQEKRGLSEKQATDIFKKLAEQVGKLLNHVRRGASGTKVTGMTAINSYIDSRVSVSFFEQLGMRPPTFLEKVEA